MNVPLIRTRMKAGTVVIHHTRPEQTPYSLRIAAANVPLSAVNGAAHSSPARSVITSDVKPSPRRCPRDTRGSVRDATVTTVTPATPSHRRGGETIAVGRSVPRRKRGGLGHVTTDGADINMPSPDERARLWLRFPMVRIVSLDC